MEKYVIIVAGGSGRRMQSDVPKQFIVIGGLPILMHTIKKFNESANEIKIILVLPEKEVNTWEKLCEKYSFSIFHEIVKGGESRFESVKNGLNTITDFQSIVAVHDGVRPFVTEKIIKESFEKAAIKGNAIAAITVKDSVRKINSDGSNSALARDNLRIIQTPQTFKYEILKESFDLASHDNFTDDASVIEAAGYLVNLIDGDYKNIKITTREDLLLAKIFLKTFT